MNRFFGQASLLQVLALLGAGLLLWQCHPLPGPSTPDAGQVARFSSTSLPTATVTPTTTNTPRPTFTPPPSPTPEPSPTATPTQSPSPTSTVTPTSRPTPTPKTHAGLQTRPTIAPTSTASGTPTPPPTASPSPTTTATPIFTSTPNTTPVADLGDLQVRVPILMYHFISIPPPGADIYRRDLSVSPERFAEHLAYLQAEGYTSISAQTLLAAMAGQQSLPPKPVWLTFDDGYADNYSNAFPLLQQYGFRGTFALVTDPIDFNDRNYLSWPQVQEMQAAGMEFGAHTRRHMDLRDRSWAFLEEEVLASKITIETQLGQPVMFFVYPAGRYDAQTLRFVETAGFELAATTAYGFEHRYRDRFELSRVRVSGADTAEILAAKLEEVWASE